MKPFKGKYRITQKFGANPSWYKPYGFKGHEGLDLVPDPKTGSWHVLSMEGGVVVRDIDAPRDNYGIYCVIWNKEKKRAWWYCHLESNDTAIGAKIAPGQKIGVMGNTGKSTAAHLHLALRHSDTNGNAINTNNGYKGFVDPLPLVEELSMEEDTNALSECLRQHADLIKQLETKGKEMEAAKKKLADSENMRKSLEIRIEELSQKLKETNDLASNWHSESESAKKTIKKLAEENETLRGEKANYKKWYENSQAKNVEHQKTGDLLREVWRRITSGKN